MNGLFITGTDTGIGKTAVSALLLAELRRRGIKAAPMKSAQTGCTKSGGHLRVPDLDYSLAMSGMDVSEEDYANMSPYTFEPACSPHLAAETAGTEIEIGSILDAAEALAARYDFLIAEGAGGLMVPLNRRELMLDLMKTLGLPVLIATRPGLGTLNHTLLSVHALRSAELKVAGIVIVESEEAEFSFIEKDNLITIEQFGGIPVLGKIPFCAQLRETNVDYSALPITVVAEVEKIVNKLGI